MFAGNHIFHSLPEICLKRVSLHIQTKTNKNPASCLLFMSIFCWSEYYYFFCKRRVQVPARCGRAAPQPQPHASAKHPRSKTKEECFHGALPRGRALRRLCAGSRTFSHSLAEICFKRVSLYARFRLRWRFRGCGAPALQDVEQRLAVLERALVRLVRVDRDLRPDLPPPHGRVDAFGSRQSPRVSRFIGRQESCRGGSVAGRLSRGNAREADGCPFRRS